MCVVVRRCSEKENRPCGVWSVVVIFHNSCHINSGILFYCGCLRSPNPGFLPKRSRLSRLNDHPSFTFPLSQHSAFNGAYIFSSNSFNMPIIRGKFREPYKTHEPLLHRPRTFFISPPFLRLSFPPLNHCCLWVTLCGEDAVKSLLTFFGRCITVYRDRGRRGLEHVKWCSHGICEPGNLHG